MSQFTKLAIYKTFIDLLNENSLDKITVQDICDRCHINRNTFYYYFEDKYAILKELLAVETKRSVDETHICQTWKESFNKAAQFALTNKKAVYHIYNSVSRTELNDYLNGVVGNLLKIFVDDQAKGLTVSDEDKAFIIKMGKYAIVGAIIDWLNTGMDQDPAYILDQTDRLFNGVIKWVLENKASI